MPTLFCLEHSRLNARVVKKSGSLLFKAIIIEPRCDCEQEVLKVKNNCSDLNVLASGLSNNAFWFTMNAAGEIDGLTFASGENPAAIGIKKNLVGELSMTMPDKGDNRVMFTKNRVVGDAKYVTRYRVHPFTRQPDRNKVDGLLVRKEKYSTRPPLGLEKLPYARTEWVYMVIGGDVDLDSSPAPVPTRVASFEQYRVDPIMLRVQTNSSVVVLSRLELNLQKIERFPAATTCVLPFQTNAQRTSDLSFVEADSNVQPHPGWPQQHVLEGNVEDSLGASMYHWEMI